MDDVIVWIIIIAFYAPLHYLPPVLMTLFRASADNRAQLLRGTVIDCTLSMAGAFALVYLVGLDNMLLAMGILLGALFLPYIRVVKLMLRSSADAGINDR